MTTAAHAAPTATPVRYFAARVGGRYRVLSTTSAEPVEPTSSQVSFVATCSSRAKAEERAAVLNAEEPWGNPPVPPMVTDDTVSAVGPMAAADPVAAAKSRPAVPAAKKGPSPEAVATAVKQLQAELTHPAVVAAIEKAMDAPLPGDEERPYRVGKRLAEAAMAADALTLGDSLRDKLAAKAPTKEGTRLIRVTFREAAALTQVATSLEVTAREGVTAGDLAAVSLVYSCTQAQAALAKLFAGPAV